MTPPTLINECLVQVSLSDGTKETVSLRQLSIRQLYQFTEHLRGDNMPALVSLCARKTDEWIDALELESYAALVKKCLELNFPRAAMLATSDPIVATKLAPLIARFQNAEKMISISGVPTNAPSPVPAASASVAATGSAPST